MLCTQAITFLKETRKKEKRQVLCSWSRLQLSWISQTHIDLFFSVFFSCPEQLNRWPCHSVNEQVWKLALGDALAVLSWPSLRNRHCLLRTPSMGPLKLLELHIMCILMTLPYIQTSINFHRFSALFKSSEDLLQASHVRVDGHWLSSYVLFLLSKYIAGWFGWWCYWRLSIGAILTSFSKLINISFCIKYFIS